MLLCSRNFKRRGGAVLNVKTTFLSIRRIYHLLHLSDEVDCVVRVDA